ncbi:MAG: LysM repeat protein [Candidatus Promineifilaceae bacterium]|jgi:LysM repeat protein
MKKKFTVITGLLTLLIVALTLIIGTGSTANAQETNLLSDPGFEGAFSGFVPIFEYQQEQCKVAGVCNTAQIPRSWTPWWTPQVKSDEDWENRMPEYKPVCPYAPCPWPERLAGGQQALQYFTFWGSHQAGFYQNVTVPVNATLKFSAFGQAWSTSGDSPTSKDPTAVNMRIGIDPTGGVNPYSPTIIWSGLANPYDAYIPFEVVAQAQGDKVTVFTWSNPTQARKHNDIYWDETALVTTDGSTVSTTTVDPVTGAVSTVAPAVDPNVRFAPAGPTPMPDAEGVIAVLVETGDTLWSIAARAGLTLDELLALNPNLTRDSFINWGDRITLGNVAPSGGSTESAEAEPATEVEEAVDPASEESASESDESASEDAAAEEVVEAPAPTSEPEPTEAPSTGSICLLAFDDVNGNGVYDNGGESLRADVAFTLAKDQAVVSNYITDGANEPFCIEGLAPGNYRISRSTTANEIVTNGSDWGASIVAGSRQQFDFGSRIEEAAMESVEIAEADAAMEAETNADTAVDATDSEASALEETSNADAESGGLTSWLVWIILAIALILVIGVGLVIMSARRATIE